MFYIDVKSEDLVEVIRNYALEQKVQDVRAEVQPEHDRYMVVVECSRTQAERILGFLDGIRLLQ